MVLWHRPLCGCYSDLYPFVDTDVGCELESRPMANTKSVLVEPLPLTGKEDQHESDKV